MHIYNKHANMIAISKSVKIYFIQFQDNEALTSAEDEIMMNYKNQ